MTGKGSAGTSSPPPTAPTVSTATSQFQVQCPDPFSFSNPSEWPKWKRRFERFMSASGLSVKSEEEQVNTLIYLMGSQAEDILLSFGLTDAEMKTFKTVVDRFENHFIIRRNVIYERAKFNSREQKDGENVDEFITSLYALAEHCGYQTLHDEMIRDRIVVGVRDRKLSEKLQMDNALTLEKAVQISRQSEAVKRQVKDLNKEAEDKNVNYVSKTGTTSKGKKNKPFSKPKQQEKEGKPQSSEKDTSWKCRWCAGATKHSRDECPAKGQTCNKCNREGHFSRACLSSKTVKRIISEEAQATTGDGSFLGAISTVDSAVSAHDRSKRWSAKVKLEAVDITWKLDPGADVTALPFHIFKSKLKKIHLQPSDQILSGPNGIQLETVGMFQGKLEYLTHSKSESIYVVKGLAQPLLGLPACEDLSMVQRINHLSSSHTNVQPKKEFAKLFKGLGSIPTPYDIQLEDGAQPFAMHTPRRVPLPLMNKLKSQLDDMVLMGVIEPVDQPTDWCAPMVITAKRNGDLRICVDLSRLNKYVKRERHPMPSVEHTLGQLAGAKYFSKLDANSGFWQIQLTEQSKLLTTFITPYGRYCYNRLPFGITSAPEHYQKRMSYMLRGLDGVLCQMDDILVWGRTIEEHDKRLRQVLQRLQEHGVTLNEAKCQYGLQRIKFLGHVLDSDGIHPDKDRIEAIVNMKAPTSVHETRMLTGLVNYLGRFTPRLSDILQPLNELLKKGRAFLWGPAQEESFNKVKTVLTSGPVLAMFDVDKHTIISADASSYGIGAVIRQKQQDGSLKPIAYASRTLSECEKRYAQIEKEALALTWACERFKDFITGLKFALETDHKPLVPIFTTKNVDDLTPRLQRFRLRMMRYDYTIFHTPGKDLIAADALSRQPLGTCEDKELEEEISAHVSLIIAHLPASDQKLELIWKEQQRDLLCRKIMKYTTVGWPEKSKLDSQCRPFYAVKDEISIQDGLLMRGCRLIIPCALKRDILGRLHAGHQGITKCRARARESVWWPGLSSEIADMISRCPQCIPESRGLRETLIPSEFPTRPWQKVAMDLFTCNNKQYLLITDYFSRYFEVALLTSTTAEAVITHCKSIFARHGVPETVMSDNGPQFEPVITSAFSKFAVDYGFQHITSSPHFPQSNGFVEAAVKIAKLQLKKNADPYKALLEYRATPLSNGYSPAELLMGRRLRSTLPMATDRYNPKLVNESDLRGKEEHRRAKQKRNFDKHHRAIDKDELLPGETVWVRDKRTWATVQDKADSPRSYIIETPQGKLRRNSFHLARAYHNGGVELDPDIDTGEEITQGHVSPPAVTPPTTSAPRQATPDRVQEQQPQDYTTRYGRVVKPVQRLNL